MRKTFTIFALIFTLLNGQEILNIESEDETVSFNLDDIYQINFVSQNSVLEIELNDGNSANIPLYIIENMFFNNNPVLPESQPLELREFIAYHEEKGVELHWKLFSNIDIDRFDIERSVSGINDWEKIGRISLPTESGYYTFNDDNVTDIYGIQYHVVLYDKKGNRSVSAPVLIENLDIVSKYKLSKNFPNPFNPVTNISYEIPKEGVTKIVIYDLLGKEIEVLFNSYQMPGKYNVVFNGGNYSSGVYVCRLVSGSYIGLIKMVLLK